MPVYEYRCPGCGDTRSFTLSIEQYDQSQLMPICFNDPADPHPMKRIFSFSKPPAFEEHFNLTTGTVTSSPRAHANELKRMSEEASARTGMPHNFVPVHPSEAREAYGITDEGLDSTYRKEVETGQREVKQWL